MTPPKTATRRHVPLALWGVAAALALGVLLFAHFLPRLSAVDPDAFFRVERLSRFSQDDATHPPRVVVIGISHTLCGLYFDGEMERFARRNGLPDVEFIRFTKLDGVPDEFIPLLQRIERASPDIVFIESNLLLFSFRQDRGGNNLLRNLLQKKIEKEESDDRKKLAAFLQRMIGMTPKGSRVLQESTNDPDSERKAIESLRGRQTDMDFERYRSTRPPRQRSADFIVPEAYRSFFGALKRMGIPCVLLDIPRSGKAMSADPPDDVADQKLLIERSRKEYGLRYLAFPEKLGLDYYIDFVHLNERGRELYSRWFLGQVPGLLARKGTP